MKRSGAARTTARTTVQWQGVSPREGAVYLGVGESTVWRMIKLGELATYTVRRRRIVPFAELQRIVAAAPTKAAS